jgi:hypothetical protein
MTPRSAAFVAAGFCALGAAAPALGQTLGRARDVDVPLWRLALALLLCLALALSGALALHARLRGAGPTAIVGRKPSLALPAWPLSLGEGLRLFKPAPARLRPIQTLRLSPHLEVCLFSCDGEEYLIAATPQGAVVLSGREPAAATDHPR